MKVPSKKKKQRLEKQKKRRRMFLVFLVIVALNGLFLLPMVEGANALRDGAFLRAESASVEETAHEQRSETASEHALETHSRKLIWAQSVEDDAKGGRGGIADAVHLTQGSLEGTGTTITRRNLRSNGADNAEEKYFTNERSSVAEAEASLFSGLFRASDGVRVAKVEEAENRTIVEVAKAKAETADGDEVGAAHAKIDDGGDDDVSMSRRNADEEARPSRGVASGPMGVMDADKVVVAAVAAASSFSTVKEGDVPIPEGEDFLNAETCRNGTLLRPDRHILPDPWLQWLCIKSSFSFPNDGNLWAQYTSAYQRLRPKMFRENIPEGGIIASAKLFESGAFVSSRYVIVTYPDDSKERLVERFKECSATLRDIATEMDGPSNRVEKW